MRMTRRGTLTFTVVTVLVGLLCLSPLPAESVTETSADEKVEKVDQATEETKSEETVIDATELDTGNLTTNVVVPTEEPIPVVESESVPVTKDAEPTEPSELKEVAVNPDAPILTEHGKLLLGTWDQGIYVRQARLTIRADGTYRGEQFSGERKSTVGRWNFNTRGELVFTPESEDIGKVEILRYSIESVDDHSLKMIPRDGSITAHITAFTRVVEEEANSGDAAKTKPLSDLEKKLLGTWWHSSFLTYVTQEFFPDRKVVRVDKMSTGEPLIGRWWVEDVATLVYELPQGKGKPNKVTKYRIVSVGDKELKLESLSPASRHKTFTYTRVKTPQASQSKTSDNLLPLGKEVERTVYDMDLKGRDYCLDFDTGQFIPFSVDELKEKSVGRRALYQWFVSSGGDAVGDPDAPVKGLIGIDMVVIPSYGSGGSRNYSEKVMVALFEGAKPGRPVSISGAGSVPATYLFQTREGSRGILHIIGHVENGVKIRYKLLSRTKQWKDFNQPLPANVRKKSRR